MALCQKKAAGESASVNKKETSAYVSDVLPGSLERYDANDIYNVDETEHVLQVVTRQYLYH